MKTLESTETFWIKAILLFALVALSFFGLCGCGTPFSVSGGFFGASVTANFPNGIQVPAKVVPTQSINSPALLVPLESALANNDSATVTDGKITATVPIVPAPVAQPTLAVPIKK